MKRIASFLGLSLLSLWTNLAQAAVTDTFACHVEAYDKKGKLVQAADANLAGLRLPMPRSDEWVDGVQGTYAATGEFKISDADGANVGISLYYTSYTSEAHPNSGSQQICIQMSGCYQNDPKSTCWATACATILPIPPFDPVDVYAKTDLTPTGVPIFRGQELNEIKDKLYGYKNWSSYKASCRLLSTIE